MNMITGYGMVAVATRDVDGLRFGATRRSACSIYVLVAFFVGMTTVPGFTSITAVIAVFSSAQLIAIGIIGEYSVGSTSAA